MQIAQRRILSLGFPLPLCYTLHANIRSDNGENSMGSGELQQVGPYTITQLLAEGPTGRFYLARHQQRKKDLIIKLLLAPLTTNEAKEAFLARARKLKKLKHRNIIEVIDYGFAPDLAGEQNCGYLVMQYAANGSITKRFTIGQRIPADEVKRILSPIADALHYAHVNNVVHGNLHPGNLLVGERNETLLTGFSYMLQGVLPSFNGETAAFPYKAPEHLQGAATAASDQYALAVMVYEWLCGRRPYEAGGPDELLHLQEREPLPAPRSLNPGISPAVEGVLMQALAHNPDERFQHIQAFADAYLYALMGLPVNNATRPARASHLGNTDAAAMPQSNSTPEATADAPGSDAMVPRATPLTARHPANDDSTQEDKAHTEVTLEGTTAPATNGSTDNEPAGKPHRRLPAEVLSSIRDEHAEQLRRALAESEGSHLRSTVSADLCEGGILSRSLPGYEERPVQVEMAGLVSRSLIENTHAIVEAGTGTGKSLAYLVPIVRSSRVAIISTANKALQEQLYYKDIPFVQEHIKRFPAALVKGMGNYVCLDRLQEERIGMQFYAKNREFMRLLKMTEDEESTFNGDFETLGFPLPGDIRSRINGDRDQCAWSKCNFFADCYVRKMKVKASNAQVIVVNHTLLLLDAAMGGYLLPERDVIVIDEAHHLEEEATRCFTITVSQAQVSTLLAQRMLKANTPVSLQDEANQVMMTTWEQLERVANPGFKGRANLQQPLEEGLHLATVITKLADALYTGRQKDLPEKENQLYDRLLARTRNLAENIRKAFSVDLPDKFVYYVERIRTPGRRSAQLEVSAAPLDITAWLQEHLFSKYNVICTSATLATVGPGAQGSDSKGPNFGYFRRRTGLDYTRYADTLERILPLTFDYEHHALLYLPRDLPEPVYGPESGGYTKAIAREMLRLVKVSHGRAFLLFSSKRMLEEVYELLAPQLEFPLLRQGDLPRIELTRRFKEEEGAVLFGLKSFWEGVDIPGEALSLVVIDKLPFDPPDDPVHEARVAQMKAAGENWFGVYVLPQTVLRLKQGLGRLLRTREDRGVMAILDTRLYTKSYGRTILNALPPARRTVNLKEVEQFFSEEPAPF
jgi:Rad3-related DNA helicase/serine/threonine protein kinase